MLAAHETAIGEHGGSLGIREVSLLESALARPQNADAYAESPLDVQRLAAMYTLGVSRNHPFVDGNKRVALVVLEMFLELNNYTLVAGDAECVTVFWALAAGELTDGEFTDWVEKNTIARTRRHRK